MMLFISTTCQSPLGHRITIPHSIVFFSVALSGRIVSQKVAATGHPAARRAALCVIIVAFSCHCRSQPSQSHYALQSGNPECRQWASKSIALLLVAGHGYWPWDSASTCSPPATIGRANHHHHLANNSPILTSPSCMFATFSCPVFSPFAEHCLPPSPSSYYEREREKDQRERKISDPPWIILDPQI